MFSKANIIFVHLIERKKTDCSQWANRVEFMVLWNKCEKKYFRRMDDSEQKEDLSGLLLYGQHGKTCFLSFCGSRNDDC